MAGDVPLWLNLREPGGAERLLRFDGGVVRVGRARDCELLLDSSYISRYHARFEHSDGRWEIIDEGSKNGVFVDDERVSGRQTLAPGDTVRLGDYTAVFVLVASDAEFGGDAEDDHDEYTLMLPPGSLPEPPRERLAVDTARRTVLIEGEPPREPLTPREYRLIETLVPTGNDDQQHSRSTLAGTLWGPGGADGDMLDRLVQRVRDKIERNPNAPEFLIEETSGAAGNRAAAESSYRLNRW